MSSTDIARQREHHRKIPYRDELITLRRAGIDFEERYLD